MQRSYQLLYGNKCVNYYQFHLIDEEKKHHV